MKKCLILVTEGYPFKRGDYVFVRDEVDILSSYFDEIIVAPQSNTGELDELPSNVILHDDLGQALRKSRTWTFESAFGYLRALFSKTTWHEIIKKKSLLIEPLKLARLVHYVYKAEICRLSLSPLVNARMHEEVTLYSYWFGASTFALAQLRIKNPATRLVTRAHGADLFYERHPGGYIPLRESTLKILDHVVLVTDSSCVYLSSREPQFAYKYVVFPLGTLDYKKKHSDLPIRFLNDSVLIVSCSSISSVKRVDRIVSSLAELEKRSEKKIKWVHFGGGPYFGDVEQLTLRLLRNSEVELRGPTARSEIVRYYATHNVDCFITFSSSEGGRPVSIMEALCFGIPVIATAVGGIPEIVDDTVGVLVTPDATPDVFAEAILSLICSPILDTKRTSARKHWEERCDAQRNYDAFARFLLNMFDK